MFSVVSLPVSQIRDPFPRCKLLERRAECLSDFRRADFENLRIVGCRVEGFSVALVHFDFPFRKEAATSCAFEMRCSRVN